MKKYSFTGESKIFYGTTVHQIIAERDFGNAKKGDIGGWIPKELNLSHDDNSWIGEGSIVLRGTTLGKNTVVGKNTTIHNEVTLGDNTVVGNYTRIYEGVTLGDRTIVGGNTVIHYGVKLGDNTVVGDNTAIHENVTLGNNTVVGDHTLIYGAVKLGKNIVVGNRTVVRRGVLMGDDVKIHDGVTVPAGSKIREGVKIDKTSDIITISNVGFLNETLTAYRTKDNDIMLNYRRSTGNLKEFEKAVEEECEDSESAKEYKKIIEFLKKYFNIPTN